ncbi:unnamed protein product [Citrullus colocynthis]|uniref:Uncharacterized protein n=1 Tax=Citrullus colocynthis TaxID=252529 RepID=A0ABP0YAJ3_9ROSI
MISKLLISFIALQLPHLDPPVSHCRTPTPITSLRISHSFFCRVAFSLSSSFLYLSSHSVFSSFFLPFFLPQPPSIPPPSSRSEGFRFRSRVFSLQCCSVDCLLRIEFERKQGVYWGFC